MANNIIRNNPTNCFEFPSHAIQAVSIDGFSKDSIAELSMPQNPENVFTTFTGKDIVWNSNSIEFNPSSGTNYVLKSLFTILAGRFQSSGTVVGMQSQVLASECGMDCKYISYGIRGVGLEAEKVTDSPKVVTENKIVATPGKYLSLPVKEGAINGEDIIDSMAFSKLIENLPIETRWDDISGIHDKGNQVEALQNIVNVLSKTEIHSKVLLLDIIEGQDIPLKSTKNVVDRLVELGLVEYDIYHGGFLFKQNIASDISFLKSNWAKLNSGEMFLIGNREGAFPGEDELHRDQRVNKTKAIVSAYNDFVESKELRFDEPVEFTSTEFLKFIKTNEKYSGSNINQAGIQNFLKNLSDPKRGALFVEEEYTENEPEHSWTKKEYLTTCKKAVLVDDNQGFLFRKVNFSLLSTDWTDFINSLEQNLELDDSYKLGLYLFENSGSYITKEELDNAVNLLGIKSAKQGFQASYLETIDTEKYGSGYVSVNGKEEALTINRINNAFIEANQYAQALAQNQPLMQEMFERNILNPGNPKMGELTGLHKIRENAAKVLVNYLVSYRKDS